jgi:hypothetical protein
MMVAYDFVVELEFQFLSVSLCVACLGIATYIIRGVKVRRCRVHGLVTHISRSWQVGR